MSSLPRYTRELFRAPPIRGLHERIMPRDLYDARVHEITISSCHPLGPQYLPTRLARHATESFVAYHLRWCRTEVGADLTVSISNTPARGPPDPLLTELLVAMNLTLGLGRRVRVPGNARDLARWTYAPQGPWEAIDAVSARQSCVAQSQRDFDYDWCAAQVKRIAGVEGFLNALPYAPNTRIHLTYDFPAVSPRDLF
jgi:hypothetical protein